MTAPTKLAAWVLTLALCACGASARQRTISATLTTLNASSAGFVAFDAKHQQDLVVAAKNRDEGVTLLAEWRAKQLVLEQALVGAYRAVALAAIASDDRSLAGMLEAAALVQKELHDLGVTP